MIPVSMVRLIDHVFFHARNKAPDRRTKLLAGMVAEQPQAVIIVLAPAGGRQASRIARMIDFRSIFINAKNGSAAIR